MSVGLFCLISRHVVALGRYHFCVSDTCINKLKHVRCSVSRKVLLTLSYPKQLSAVSADYHLNLLLLHNREPSVLLVPLELRDPPACRVCLVKEEVPAFLDPKETELVMMGTKRSILYINWSLLDWLTGIFFFKSS